MSTLLGIALVLATWIVAGATLIAIGLLPASVVARGNPSATTSMVIRHAIWWGLAVTVMAVLGLNTFSRVSAPIVGIALLLIAAISGSTGAIVLRKMGITGWHVTPSASSATFWVLATVFVLAQVYWAWTALGPATNYDSGLYHLGAVTYASDYAAIPGMANLYPAFGYATAQFPLAAVFTQFGWGPESFRLINGFMLALVALDVILRVRRRPFTPGTYVLLVMVTVAWIALVGLADYWVTSPSQDTSAWLITAVAIAYLVDALDPRAQTTERVAVSALTIALVTTLVLVRSTLAAFALLVLIVLAWNVRSQFRRGGSFWKPATLLSGLVITAGALVLLVRDYLLSGWLMFPLDLLPTGARWQAADPAATSQAILGYHRDPGDIWGAADGWGWIPGWLGRLPSQWEFWAAALLWLVAVVALARVRTALRPYGRSIVLTALPVAGATVIWFLVTPPSPRFAWGLIFGLPAVLLGWALWATRGTQAIPAAPAGRSRDTWVLVAPTAGIAAVLAFSGLFRADSSAPREEFLWAGLRAMQIPVVPVPQPGVSERTLPSGLTVLVPDEGELCWARFPLCSPSPNPSLGLLGADLSDGLVLTPTR